MKCVYIFFLLISLACKAEVYDTEHYCLSNNGKSLKIRKSDYFSILLCNNGRVDIFHTKNNEVFFSFSEGALKREELIVSVKIIYPEIFFTTVIARDSNVISRVIQGAPSQEGSYKHLLEKKDSIYKFDSSGDLYLHRNKNCAKTPRSVLDTKCFVREKIILYTDTRNHYLPQYNKLK